MIYLVAHDEQVFEHLRSPSCADIQFDVLGDVGHRVLVEIPTRCEKRFIEEMGKIKCEVKEA